MPGRRPPAGPRASAALPSSFAAVVDADAELVARLQGGDEEAFAALVRLYQIRLLRVARSIAGRPAVAEEVVQDTWLGVVRGIERFEGHSSLKTWLFRILVNRARSAVARERRAGPPTADADAAVSADRFDSTGAWTSPPDPWTEAAEDRLVSAELARKVKECVKSLPDNQREVVLLRDVEGLSAPDVCTVLGITDGYQRVLLHRGRAKVRGMLENEMAKG